MNLKNLLCCYVFGVLAVQYQHTLAAQVTVSVEDNEGHLIENAVVTAIPLNVNSFPKPKPKVKKEIVDQIDKEFFPFVKVVTLANVIGAHNMRDEGDIDFFIITTRGRIWLTRLFCTGLTKILNKRPTKNNKRDKICLSFYISEDSLNLDDLKIKPTDPYFEYWLKTMILLYNKDRVYENFLKANNLRAEQINNQIVGSSCKLLGHYSENIQNCIFFDYLEKIFKKWQLKIMPIALKKIRVDSQGKFINDKILKLYWRDRNAEILDKFNYELNRIF